MKYIFTILLVFIMTAVQAYAEKRYVTDRVLLGVHADSDEESVLIKSIPSGTEVEILDTVDNFVQVKLEDGIEGWVNSGFLMKTVPSTRKYDVLAYQYEKTTHELDRLKKDYAKKDRELEVRRDQISNANTSIKELKKRTNGKIVIDPEIENKLSTSLQQIEALKLKIIEMESTTLPEPDINQTDILKELKEVKLLNKEMQTRVEIALAHLKGERVPTAEEMASLRPQFPTWYWGLLMVILLFGVITGLFVMDYHFRRRHGGFRI